MATISDYILEWKYFTNFMSPTMNDYRQITAWLRTISSQLVFTSAWINQSQQTNVILYAVTLRTVQHSNHNVNEHIGLKQRGQDGVNQQPPISRRQEALPNVMRYSASKCIKLVCSQVSQQLQLEGHKRQSQMWLQIPYRLANSSVGNQQITTQ